MRHGPWLAQGNIHNSKARRQASTDLGRFRVLSLGLPSGTRGPGGGCEASTGEMAALFLSFFDSFLPDLSFFSGLSGLSGFAVAGFTPASSMLELLGLSLLAFAVGGEQVKEMANKKTESVPISSMEGTNWKHCLCDSGDGSLFQLVGIWSF